MKFKTISEKKIFKNDVITVFERKLHLPNNNIVTWTFTETKNVVGIIANIEDKVILIKQYRPAIEKDLIEIPAGLVETGETIESAAKREFEEETGYKAGKIEKICSYFNTAGLNGTQYHLFYAYELEKTKQKLDENEFIEVLELPLRDINIFELEDPKTMIALTFLKNKLF